MSHPLVVFNDHAFKVFERGDIIEWSEKVSDWCDTEKRSDRVEIALSYLGRPISIFIRRFEDMLPSHWRWSWAVLFNVLKALQEQLAVMTQISRPTHDSDQSGGMLSTAVKVVGGAALVAGVTALAGVALTRSIGFGAAGIARGSPAARWQSSIGSAAKGSLFSKAQSLGATRAVTTAVAAAGMAGGQAMQKLRPALQIMQSTGVARILGPSHQVELDWNQAATVDIPVEFVREVRLMGVRAD